MVITCSETLIAFDVDAQNQNMNDQFDQDLAVPTGGGAFFGGPTCPPDGSIPEGVDPAMCSRK